MSSARKRRDTDDAHLWMREAWDKLVTAKGGNRSAAEATMNRYLAELGYE